MLQLHTLHKLTIFLIKLIKKNQFINKDTKERKSTVKKKGRDMTRDMSDGERIVLNEKIMC
jgi:hypothetical protein